MTTSSEYGFPIFISSTDYNLVDLRAELAKYLSDLGYRPILSSSEGFHDNSPEMEPWESCLQVLQSAYIMVLVIDGKYGDVFEWKSFASIIGDRKVSPTHAEYIFAHKTKMRMLVFVRKELMTYYQTYRTAIKNSGGDKKKARESLEVSLPRHIAFETLELIEEIKTTRPIPWIKSFDNVTDIKQEIQMKMLNELAELFLFKNKHLESVIRAFSTVLDDLPEEKRKEALSKIGVAKELMDEIENQTKVIYNLKEEKDKVQSQLNIKEDELQKAQKDKKTATTALKKKVNQLTLELGNIETQIQTHELNNANYLISGAHNSKMAWDSDVFKINTINPWGTPKASILNSFPISNNSPFMNIGIPAASPFQTCDKCHSSTLTATSLMQLRTCPSCRRRLCNNCFNGIGNYIYATECEDCRKKNSNSYLGIPTFK